MPIKWPVAPDGHNFNAERSSASPVKITKLINQNISQMEKLMTPSFFFLYEGLLLPLRQNCLLNMY